MKLIGLEEHFVTDDFMAAWHALDPKWQDIALKQSDQGETGRRLADLGEERTAAMDETGLDVQVLALTAPGLQNLDAIEADALQRSSNDFVAATVRSNPERYQGFATLATPDPKAAARELERAVTELGLNGAMLFGRGSGRRGDNAPLRCDKLLQLNAKTLCGFESRNRLLETDTHNSPHPFWPREE